MPALRHTKVSTWAVAKESQRLAYQEMAAMWRQRSSNRWQMLYLYLVSSSIFLLAWATLAASSQEDPNRTCALILFSAFGAIMSFIWALWTLRESAYVEGIEAQAQQLETDLFGTLPTGAFTWTSRKRREHRDFKWPTRGKWLFSGIP